MAEQIPYATMKVGDWEYGLPRYMQHVLEVAGLTDGDYDIKEFIDRIDQVQYDRDRDGEISLFIDIAKLLFVEFARMADPHEPVELANVQATAGVETIDLVDRALPEPKISNQ